MRIRDGRTVYTVLGCLVTSVLIGQVSSTTLCVPDVPAALLSDPSILDHPAVTDALQKVRDDLGTFFSASGVQDGVSIEIAHTSGPSSMFSFNYGNQRQNKTNGLAIDGDTIFRVNSIAKSLVAAMALVVMNESRSQRDIPQLRLDTPLIDILPSFSLPEKDWENGGSEITVSMLGSESSGLCREGYQTDFNVVSGQSQASLSVIGNLWASATPASVIKNVAEQGLMFAPGQRAAYSNAGYALLGYGIANVRNRLQKSNLTWSQVAANDVFKPLNMSHSFFGPIPDKLNKRIAIPVPTDWADLVVMEGYDPAAGMWSSANDLVSYMHNMWLKPIPDLITSTQRRNALQPRISLPDGVQQVGFGWEITLAEPDADGTTYAIYGKSGDGGGYHSYFSLVPNLGFGIVALTKQTLSMYNTLIPAYRTAYSSLLGSKYAGTYGTGGDNHALVELEDDVLYLRDLTYKNVSALLRIDMLGWTPGVQPRYFSGPNGSALAPTDIGEGANFRIFAESANVTGLISMDEHGWALDKVQFIENADGTVDIVYPPLGARLTRN